MLEAGAATDRGDRRGDAGGGFPMGPFELMDLTGIDVKLAAATGDLGGPRPAGPAPAVADPGAPGRGRHWAARPAGASTEYADGQRLGEAERAGRHARRTEHLSPAADPRPDPRRDRHEARFAVAEGVASPDDIDLALRLGAGHPHRPFRVATTGHPDGSTSLTARLRWAAHEAPVDAVDRSRPRCSLVTACSCRAGRIACAIASPTPNPTQTRTARAGRPDHRDADPRPTATAAPTADPHAVAKPVVRRADTARARPPGRPTSTRSSRHSCRR